MGRIMGIQINPCKRKHYKPTTLQKWIDQLSFYIREQLPFYDGIRDQLIILKYDDIVEIRDLLQEQKNKQKGIWLDEEEPFWIYAKCSECGSVQDAKSQYCPTCGCLMEYEEETE
jgi:hypothetical protein